MIKRTVRGFAAQAQSPGLAADLADLARGLSQTFFDSYRPELHYMRGPGPKWHAKHDPAPAEFDDLPALLRVRAKG